MKKPRLSIQNIYSMKSHYNLILVVVLIIFGCSLTSTAIAEVQTTVRFQPPPESEQPKDTEGAASRQTERCPANSLVADSDRPNIEPRLTAVVPPTNRGLTTAERPNLWIYLPETSAQQAILTIKQNGKIPHWQQTVAIANTTGVVGIKLSEAAPSLEIGRDYQWAIILVCGDRPSPNDPVITSWIERVAPKNNSAKSGLEEASTYAQQGIWYDALDALIAEKSSLPNWQDIWSEYLESTGLEQIADRPVIYDFFQ